MKRLGSSDSLGVLMSICPNSSTIDDESNPGYYAREFQTVLEEEGCGGHVSEKKRRLSVDQVKALEKNFEVENKLEPDRKVKLAQEIGLQPRQVAVWFQNRRARFKTKQLERDYAILKSNFDKLKQNYDSLHHDNQTLLNQIREMKSKIHGEGETERKECHVKEEAMVASDGEEKSKLDESPEAAATELDFHHNPTDDAAAAAAAMDGGSVFLDFKDGGLSDSTDDSSAILNEENSSSPFQFLEIQNGTATVPLKSGFQFPDSYSVGGHKQHHVKVEEHNFFGEESCTNLFTDDQPPTLHWYCSDQWN